MEVAQNLDCAVSVQVERTTAFPLKAWRISLGVDRAGRVPCAGEKWSLSVVEKSMQNADKLAFGPFNRLRKRRAPVPIRGRDRWRCGGVWRNKLGSHVEQLVCLGTWSRGQTISLDLLHGPQKSY